MKTSSPYQMGLSAGYYDDLRLIKEHRSYWILKKNNLRITIQYEENNLSSVFIQRFLKNKKKASLLYVAQNNLLKLKFAYITEQENYNYTVFKDGSDQQCLSQIKTEGADLLGKLSDKINDDTLYDSLDAGAIDPNCKSILGNEKNAALYLGAFNSLKFKTAESKETNLTSCLKTDPSLQKIFANDEKSKDQLELLEAKLNLESAKMYSQSPQLKPFIKCSSSDKPAPVAQCNESGVITFYKNTPENSLNKNDFDRAFSHELLHSVGVTDEKIADTILQVCIDKKAVDPDKIQKSYASTSRGLVGLLTVTPTINAALAKENLQAVSDTPAAITQDVAAAVPKQVDPVAANIPTAQQLAATTTLSTATDSGAAAVVQQSTTQSSGILNFANQVTASFVTPATASTTTLTSAGVTVPNVTTSTAAAATRTPASISTLTPSVVGSGEKVVEEIDLDKKAGAANAGIDVNKIAAASVSEKALSAGTTRQGTTGGNNPELASATAINSNNGGYSGNGATPVIGGGSGGNDTATPIVRSAQRAPAAVSSSTALVTAPSREELTTYFLNGDYSSARQKLQDPKMQQNLKATGISIVDLNGNTLGAPKGNTIILDQGDRFVRQK